MKRASRGFSPSLEQREEIGVLRQPASGSRVRGTRTGWLLAAGIGLAVLLSVVSCGVKAPPQPRELVVPAPVEDVAVTPVPEGLRITFTLPSESLDGSPLKEIGGYRILREGPEGEGVREEIRFSVSEMKQRVGKSMDFLDVPPEQAGVYRYCVVPFDIYGSRPSKRHAVEFCWEGFLSDEREGSPGAGGLPAP